jgi:5'-deoxynucleotidase YfbR-like HD superfamily hydrolase
MNPQQHSQQNNPRQPLSTADLAAAARMSPAQDGHGDDETVRGEMQEDLHDDVHDDMHDGMADGGRRRAAADPVEELAALFAPDAAREFRARWDEIQIGFVDDPGQAVRRADELVAQVMQNLAETFARERAELEQYLGGGQQAQASTENLRVALRRYRSFFQRLLSL